MKQLNQNSAIIANHHVSMSHSFICNNIFPKRYFLLLAFVSMALLVGFTALAQCNTFINADAANPILHATPVPQNIHGLFFVDIDGDGDLDCYISTKLGTLNEGDYVMSLYRNVGTAKRPQFELSATNGFANPTDTGTGVFAFVDIDGDGDYDLFVTKITPHDHPTDYIDFYRNEGTAQNPKFVEDQAHNPLPQTYLYDRVEILQITFPNINAGYLGDNKTPDYFIYYASNPGANRGPEVAQAYLNGETTTTPTFTLYTQDVGNVGRLYYDWNKDGRTDYFMGGSYYETDPAPFYYPVSYLTTTNAPIFAGNATSTMVDLNNDGAPETFDAQGHYATLAPVAVIKVVPNKSFNTNVTRLMSVTTSLRWKYSWERNGVVINGANQSYLDVSQPGAYVLHIMDACGTGVSLPYYKRASIGANDGKYNNYKEFLRYEQVNYTKAFSKYSALP